MKNRIVLMVLSVVMFCAAIGITVYFFWANGYFKPTTESAPTTTYDSFTYPSFETTAISDMITESAEETGETEYVCPVDFASLQAANPDIIGWIYMEEPYISLPILMNPTDDTVYLYHDAEGNYSKEGALFVEHKYNSGDFTDPCTIIYGHRMSDGSMFGSMQGICQEAGYFDEPRYIVIYTPTETKIYQVFAITSTDNSHLMLKYDFDDPDDFNEFIDTVYSDNSIGFTHLEDIRPEAGDNILILSSCLWGDRLQRFLVLAVEV